MRMCHSVEFIPYVQTIADDQYVGGYVESYQRVIIEMESFVIADYVLCSRPKIEVAAAG
jgi:hypothetical protein